MSEKFEIRPQEGPQTQFLSTTADIAIYGGAAGGGKTYSILLEILRHMNNPRFAAVVFRRTTPQIKNPGGLWDESIKVFPMFGAKPKEMTLRWKFPSGMQTVFSHMEYEKNMHDWQGSQIPLICFDEVTHFTMKQFFYMLSRNRSTSGVPGYLRATCNPDPDSWVREFIDWWIGDDGFPIPERAGKVRWFCQLNDEIHWRNTRFEIAKDFGEEAMPKSCTFIPAKLSDNKILMEQDPAYLASLNALPRVERLRLLGGNWDIRAAAGNFFKRVWFPIIKKEDLPPIRRSIRYWDRASTEEGPGNDGDFTVGIKLSQCHNGKFYIEHIMRFRGRPAEVEKAILSMASIDGKKTAIGLSIDPGQAGKFEMSHYIKVLSGYHIFSQRETGDKETRARPASSQAEHGNLIVVEGEWNKKFFDEADNFPESKWDDQIDALSGAISYFTSSGKVGKITNRLSAKKSAMAPSFNSGRLW